MDRLAERIEELRQELYRVAQSAGLADPRLLELSQRLDRLIVQWHRQQEQPVPALSTIPPALAYRHRRRQPAPT
ncbi:MAG TPA: aspartyl-phosphate phosphatase Spo0E family protein [Thermaerobacter sp.]